MKKEYLKINKIPTIIWGESSKHVYLAIHGQGGNKEEAEILYNALSPCDAQIISIDLPKHGERFNDDVAFLPWEVIPELEEVMQYIHLHWQQVSLYANSIGAFFSMMSYEKETFQNIMFVSPIIDMNIVIMNMMKQNHISEERLKKEQYIPTTTETLSWKYLCYIRENPIVYWHPQTKILYSQKDHLVDTDTIQSFCEHFHCHATIIKTGEHWFHTKEQLDILCSWIKKAIV